MIEGQCFGKLSRGVENTKSAGNKLSLFGYRRRYDCRMVLSATPTTSPTSEITNHKKKLSHKNIVDKYAPS